MLALAALAVKLGDGGPVLFRQTRVGKDGEDFELLKLRTMVVGAETKGAGYAVDQRRQPDHARRPLPPPHVDRRAAAALERRARRDEPDRAAADAPLPGREYTERQRRRLEVLPGITGWAQIHGRAALSWDERIELDVWYVEHRSPRTDLLILLRTPLALFGGTYKGETGRLA